MHIAYITFVSDYLKSHDMSIHFLISSTKKEEFSTMAIALAI